MSRKGKGRRNTRALNARLDTELDADLIDWLDAQPKSKRSEAIRDLMRDGLRMRQMEGNFASMVRQAVAEALAGIQLTDAHRASNSDTNEVEETFGNQLNQLLGRFG
jgi:hypothetical protein